MDTKEYIRLQIAAAWRTYDGITSDLTDDLLNWVPSGKANTISATLAHILGGEDMFIQAVIQDKPTLWKSQNWAEKIGVDATPGPGTHWEKYVGRQLSLESFRGYQAAVRAATRSYLEAFSADDLERKVPFAGGERSVADMLVLLVIHITEHSGEISALKGIQGAKGMPM